jgi:3-isopropylmalate dehydratase small subunit
MLKGTVTTIFGDDINTDDIIPAFRLQQSNDPEYFANYAFEKFDPEFRGRCGQREANIVLAGKNFGCGSSREQAVYALQYNRVACVIAGSFPDIFYRNCLPAHRPAPDRSGIGMGTSSRWIWRLA